MGRVGGQVHDRVAGGGCAPAAAALVEQDDPVRRRVETPPPTRGGPRARSAVQHDGGLPLGVTAGLPVDEMAVADVEQSAVVRLDVRVPLAHMIPLCPDPTVAADARE